MWRRACYLRHLGEKKQRILDAVDDRAPPNGTLLERKHRPGGAGDAIYEGLTEKPHASSMLSTFQPARVAQFSSASTIAVASDLLFMALEQKKTTFYLGNMTTGV